MTPLQILRLLWVRALFSAMLGSLLAAAAPAQMVTPEAPGSGLRAGDYRVAGLAWRLATGGRALCPRTVPQSGLALHHLAQYAPGDRAVVAGGFALERGPGIVAIAPGSPAARAGLRAGDVLLSVDGEAFDPPTAIAAERRLEDRRRRIAQSEALLDRHLGTGPVRLRILRADADVELELQAEPGCPIRARLANSTQLNAFSDGETVVVTSRLLAFVDSDDELAIVLAHELAHNVLGHAAALRQAGVPRGFLRRLGRNAAMLRQMEEDADRLAARLVAAAGFDPAAGIALWQRLERQPRGLRLFATHPGAGERARRWAAAVAALNAGPE